MSMWCGLIEEMNLLGGSWMGLELFIKLKMVYKERQVRKAY